MDNIIYIPMQKPQAQGGPRFRLFTPHLAPIFSDFHQRSMLMHFSKMVIFFKLHLACPLCPPHLHHARAAPTPRPRHTQNRPFKITLLL